MSEHVNTDPANTVVLVDNELLPSVELTELLAECGLQVRVWSKSFKSLVADTSADSFAYVFLNVNYCGDPKYFAEQALSLNAPVVYFNPQSEGVVPDDAEQPFYYLTGQPSVVDVRVALEVSRYKFRSRGTISSQLNMLSKAFSCVGDYLICLDFQGHITHVNTRACELFCVNEAEVKGTPWYTLIKTRQDLSARHTQQFISAAINTRAVTKIQPIALQISKKESVLVDGIIGPTNESGNKTGVVCILRQLTSLGALPDLVSSEENADEIDIHRIEATGTLLFSPDQLNNINLRYGRLVGDRILVEIGEELKSVLRPTDLATHYGGANFLVLFSESTKAQIDNLVKILQKKLVSHKFHDGQISLTFSFGLATNNELVNYSPVELFYYANYSLAQAQDLGGDQIRIWKQENALQQIGNFDRVSGNFSETGSTDYQKMLMLWSILNNPQHIATETEFLEFLLSHLNSGFELAKSAFFALEGDSLNFKVGLDATRSVLGAGDVGLSDNQQEYMEEVRNGETQEVIFTSILGDSTEVCVVIKGNKSPLGLLWLAFAAEQTFSLKNQRMLDNIAEFAAVKLEQLASSVNQPKSKLNTSAGEEQDGINFWYTSREMAEQAEFIEKVAPTDATVLITGESGTGKELLAKSIHARSTRKDKPFVIFDCGAVVESLIESELFGHKRGAFTGASKDSVGCIQRAHKGTLFLDEVGELPIETQVKLLRFTQEKQFAQVGSNSYKKVDVRLVAATNVDLLERIKKGLFREDLYYRLNVFNLKSLPLRKRKDDILYLAGRYLTLFAEEYSKSIVDFSEDAKQALHQYEWPGNVRELRNLIHKAVILCQSRLLNCTDLGLYPLEDMFTETADVPSVDNASVVSLPGQMANKSAPTDVVTLGFPEHAEQTSMWQQASTADSAFSDRDTAPSQGRAADPGVDDQEPVNDKVLDDSHWTTLISMSREQGFQIAPWLERCLMERSLRENNQVVLRAANTLGVAESSFRRKWQKLQDISAPLTAELAASSERAVHMLLSTPQITNKVETMQALLTQACEDLSLSATQGARVLAVSAPTYRKMRREIAG
ncbi:sigma 54-interacting transcriptional regulator [Alteromonas sp. ASW11-19]|uniref:Sigma 54-interacting transcriptional regulator n=1 Tax=Alteromonas salexigens TaxID=2982530 RepID=A0ABT2VQL3_9ALTE|nr:sigma 54-interacting transcriptional regulator [Alteromonas salexigens]MCU7555369.1 sigma 54-interacting transcriptional regulator [Alteromonas salexigens]